VVILLDRYFYGDVKGKSTEFFIFIIRKEIE